MRNKRSKNYPRCAVCGRRPNIFIATQDNPCFLCSSCDNYFFDDLLSLEAKLERLISGMKMAQEKQIGLGFALNVVKGRYSLRQAQKRHALKQREKEGKSVDIFTVGKRMPGGYK